MNYTSERIVVPSHTPKPLPNHLRTELTSALLSESAIPTIQSALSDECREAGWMDALRQRAKQLIRNGNAVTWQEVVNKLANEVKGGLDNRPNAPGGLRRGYTSEGSRSTVDQSADKTVKIEFPEIATERGIKVVRNALENIVEVENTEAQG
ncbi:MAG: hypothetical protein Q9218_005573 [Villophora microphyllina]